jgi:hypothetical protein
MLNITIFIGKNPGRVAIERQGPWTLCKQFLKGICG